MNLPRTPGGLIAFAIGAVVMTAVGIAILARIPGVWAKLLGIRST